MGLSSRTRIRAMRDKIVSGSRRAWQWLRRQPSDIDVWVQNHTVGVIITLFFLLLGGTGLLLWIDGDAVIHWAKIIAPILNIIAIVSTAILNIIKWFRVRRDERLAHEAQEQGVSAEDTGGATEETGESRESTEAPLIPHSRDVDADQPTGDGGAVAGTPSTEGDNRA